MDANGSVALTVGGASGMANATARLLASKGAQVAILDLESSRGEQAAAEIGGGTIFCPVDVRDSASIAAALDAACEAFGAVHIVVNTAGGGMARRTLSKQGPHPLEDFRNTVELNLIGTFDLLRQAAERMAANEPNADGERGVVINTASIAAFEGQIGQVAYASAKAGIVGMTFTAARELGGLGIRVLAIAPSLFETGITQGIPDEFAAALTKDAAFPKRMGRPEEYAKLALAIVENPMLNASTLRLDGGQRFAPR
ncbi:MAG: SDR family oxidoreductase [Deltaproteobacteria bacterium]|nr:SDR family oxidoreductase [Deltaproteobacteria bacterium]MBW2359683.1 SDR family oxidoreductase [Deltaproteobacteria bacterium]